MTANRETVKKHPLFFRILYKLGLTERREDVPDMRSTAQTNLIIGLLALVVTFGAVIGWLGTDNYRTRAISEAKFSQPSCDNFKVVDSEETADTYRYTIDSCGDVAVYTMNKLSFK